jgi:hypothetical protein
MAHYPRPFSVTLLRILGWIVILLSCVVLVLFVMAFGDMQMRISSLSTPYAPALLLALTGGFILMEGLGFTVGIFFLCFGRVIAELSDLRQHLAGFERQNL